MRMRRHALVMTTAAAVFTVAACGGGTPESADAPADSGAADSTAALDSLSTEELVAQAEEEGTVVVYSFTSRIAAVEEAFEAQYPGIDVVASDLSSTEQIAQITAQSGAGADGADVTYISDGPVVLDELLGPGLIHNYVPPRIVDSLPAQYQQPLLTQRLSTKVLMYNEAAYPDGSPITNLWQLTDEQWRGKVVMVDPAVRADYLDLLTEIVIQSDAVAQAYQSHFATELVLDEGIPNAGSQFIADLWANDVVLVGDTDEVNAAIGTIDQADPPVGFTSYSDRRDNEDEGWALQVAAGIDPSPGIVFGAYLGLVEGGNNPAAGRLLIDFLMGDDSTSGGPAYEPFYVAGDYPVRTTMRNPEGAESVEDLGGWIIDPQATVEQRSEVADFVLTLE